MRPHLDVRMEGEALAQLGALDPKRDPTSALPYCDNNNKDDDKEKNARTDGGCARWVEGKHGSCVPWEMINPNQAVHLPLSGK